MEIFKLARDARGNFKRDLGWEWTGSKWQQHRFYLGRDRTQAAIRVGRLEALWAAVEGHWNRSERHPMPEDSRDRQRPSWSPTTLAIAGAIGRGEESVEIDSLSGADAYLELLHNFGHCGIRLVPPAASEAPLAAELQGQVADLERSQGKAQEFLNRHQERLEEEAERGRQKGLGSQSLHQALDAYAAHLAKTMLLPDGSGRPSLTCKVWLKQVRLIKAHAADVPLGLFNLDRIDAMIHYWAGRPTLLSSGLPARPDTVKEVIKRVRTFIKWLHRTTGFKWRKPEDYETSPVRVRLTPAEMSARLTPDRVQTYTLEELGMLYEAATPWERFLMVLALNTGFGIDQLSMLQVSEIHAADERHPSPWIGRVRYKTGVYGEWTLWPQTVQAIAWMQLRRGQSKETALMVTLQGKPPSLTSGGNANQAIPNAWHRLTGRIRRQHPGFRALSFNKLRKTAIDLIRQLTDGETAGVFACHGRVVSDDLLEKYANRHFAKVAGAIDLLHKLLAPVLGRVDDPFPPEQTGRMASPVTPAQGRRMTTLRAQGYTLKKIGEEVGLDRGTVGKYLKADGD